MAEPAVPTAGEDARTRGGSRQVGSEHIAHSALALPTILHALRETSPPPGGVLTAYIDTSPPRSIGQAYLLDFRNRAKAIRKETPKPRRAIFDAAVAQAEAVMTGQFSPGAPGLAIFASGEETYIFAAPLPESPAEFLAFKEQPVLAPLEAAIDDSERAAVLLFDKERARLFTIFLGEIEERQILVDDVPGKQQTGGWFGLAQKRYERHHEDHVLRHAKRTIAALRAELERRPFDRLLIGGPDEAIALLEDHLPRPLRLRLEGKVSLELFARDADVLAAATTMLAEIERRHEAEAVRRLLDDAGTPRVVLGARDTLAALSDGRVHQLFIVNADLGPARQCPACGLLSPNDDPCSRCGAATREAGDLRERATAAAIDSDARIELVSGEAAELLMPHGGIGARTRWG